MTWCKFRISKPYANQGDLAIVIIRIAWKLNSEVIRVCIIGKISCVRSNRKIPDTLGLTTVKIKEMFRLLPNRHFFPGAKIVSFRFVSSNIISRPLVSHWEVMAHISIYCGFCLWSAGFVLWCNSIFFDLFWSVKLWIRVLIFSKVPFGFE